MPELPEVETTVSQLKNEVLNRTFLDVWTDFPKMIKTPETFKDFKKKIKRKKIERIYRIGKNIIFDLSENLSLLIHQKLTGHLLSGYWILDNGSWESQVKGPLKEKVNTYIHLMFFLDKEKMLALSDLRKFAKVELEKTEKIKKELKNLGPDPLKINFKEFKQRLVKKRGKIKKILMAQEIISGVGNIYSDEALFAANIHPLKEVSELKENDLKRLYQSLKKILKKAIDVQGTSVSDYRTIGGKKGGFGKLIKVYRREGEKCPRCGAIIKRIKIGGRSAHYCPKCQKL